LNFLILKCFYINKFFWKHMLKICAPTYYVHLQIFSMYQNLFKSILVSCYIDYFKRYKASTIQLNP